VHVSTIFPLVFSNPGHSIEMTITLTSRLYRCFKTSFTIAFQMLLSGECYENVYVYRECFIKYVQVLSPVRPNSVGCPILHAEGFRNPGRAHIQASNEQYEAEKVQSVK
jgi:hypothetical protein